jgi:hypothetical protein
MKAKLSAAVVLCVSVGLAGCEGVAANSMCASSQDVAHKVTALTDNLNAAWSAGKITHEQAGEIAADILAAGRTKNAAAYCTALDKVRVDALL